MTPGQIQGSIDQIVEGLNAQREAYITAKGSDSTQQPFTITFDPDVTNYEEMMQILETVRSRFPQWRIRGEWKS